MEFKCKKCGNCCNCDGYLFVDLKDVVNISKFLKITSDEFILKYLTKDDDDRFYVSNINKVCVFYENGCTIYDVRPWQCRSYPYWYNIVKSKKNWNKESTFCKGMK